MGTSELTLADRLHLSTVGQESEPVGVCNPVEGTWKSRCIGRISRQDRWVMINHLARYIYSLISKSVMQETSSLLVVREQRAPNATAQGALSATTACDSSP
jgi:hypothetical protein